MFPTAHGVVSQGGQTAAPPTGGFPTVVATTNNDGDNLIDTSHTIALPTGVQAGDLLVVIVRVHDLVIGGMAGWTQLATRTAHNASAIYFRVADGPLATATLTAGTISRIAWVAYRITGAAGIEGAFANENTLQPPQLTPSWGPAKTLWLTAATDNQSNFTFTEPALYSDQVDGGNPSSAFTSRHRVAAAQRELEAASEQPGPWTRSGTASAPHAATIAIRPQ